MFGDDYNDGVDAYIKQDYKTAHKFWLPLAEQGDAKAQNSLGVMHVKGQGVPQDDKEAVKWFLLSAEQGLPEAQFSLGKVYGKGVGVLQDYKEALKWNLLSAEQGFAYAQFSLGIIYVKGLGVPQDYVLAHMWFSLSGSNGYKDGVKNKNLVEKRMTPEQIEKAQELARNWKPTNQVVQQSGFYEMKKRLVQVMILVVTVLLLSTTAYAQDGNDLLMNCSEISKASYRSGYCLGKISGVALGLEWSKSSVYCRPAGVAFGQLVGIVVKFLRNHPERLHEPDDFLILLSMKEAFPCSLNEKPLKREAT